MPVYGRFTETDLADEMTVLDVNVRALTALTKQFVRPMVDRGEGAVLNTASLASFYPLPTKAVYAATKSYVLSFSRSLAHDLSDEGVTVSAVCPGPVETEYAERGGVEDSETMSGSTNDAESVAEAGWQGLKDGERIIFPSTLAAYGGQLVRLLPRRRATVIGEETIEEGASWL